MTRFTEHLTPSPARDWPSRRPVPEWFFGEDHTDEEITRAKELLQRGAIVAPPHGNFSESAYRAHWDDRT